MKTLKIIVVLSLIGVSIYWYFKVATPDQQEFVKEKATAIKDKGIELYDNRDKYMDQVANVGQKVSNTIKTISGENYESEYSESHFYGGQPVNISYPNSLSTLSNIGFVVAYDETRKNPAWVGYRVFKDDIEKGPKRPSRFSIDKRTNSKVSHNDYTNSGFDRGHMAPNYAIALRYGVDAQKETFFMSNIVPQEGDLNQGPWRELEEEVGTIWANKFHEVWVITGPLYDSQVVKLNNGTEVPDSFFKIVVDAKEDKVRAIAFVMPQTAGRRDDFGDYITSVDEVESLSGFDFLADMDDEYEAEVESVVERVW